MPLWEVKGWNASSSHIFAVCPGEKGRWFCPTWQVHSHFATFTRCKGNDDNFSHYPPQSLHYPHHLHFYTQPRKAVLLMDKENHFCFLQSIIYKIWNTISFYFNKEKQQKYDHLPQFHQHWDFFSSKKITRQPHSYFPTNLWTR